MSELPAGNFLRECIICGSSDIIITEDGEPVLYKVSDNSKFMTSNIFAARITEYVPQLHSFFADIGDTRRALLSADSVGMPDRPLRVGDFCLVQMMTAARGKKGARVSAAPRLTGVFLVLLPAESEKAVNLSSKISDCEERARLHMIGESLGGAFSVILRTQAVGASAAEIAAEYQKLESLWNVILRDYEALVRSGTPGLVYGRNPLFSEILKYPLASYRAFCVDTPAMVDALRREFPETTDRIRFIPQRIFAAKSVDRVATSLLGRQVFLKSGADLVIEKTEALTVIDVNSGKSASSYRDVNFEAAREIMRQLRLRDIGGIIICDFIDMDNKQDRADLTSFMRSLAPCDPAQPEIVGLTPLGLMEISRKRS